jgi:dUTP pyrophosphatase
VSWNVTKCDEDKCIEIQITSRSGMAKKHRVWLAKGVGTIDQDYTNTEIGVDLINCGDKDYVIKAGDSIAQAIFRTDINVNFPELVINKEREGGFGSTGK